MRLRAHVLPFALLLACAGAGAHAAQDTAPASTPAATPADTDDTPPAPPPGADQITVLTAARIHTEDLAQPQVTAIAWDGQGRRSEVRVNRVIRVDPDALRRVSVSVSAEVFEVVVAGMRRHLA